MMRIDQATPAVHAAQSRVDAIDAEVLSVTGQGMSKKCPEGAPEDLAPRAFCAQRCRPTGSSCDNARAC